jgi:hypothetical protein
LVPQRAAARAPGVVLSTRGKNVRLGPRARPSA